MERNKEFLLKRAQTRYASEIATGAVAVQDRFGQPVRAGSLVVWHTPYDLVWQVTGVEPVLDPKQAMGLARLTLTCTVPMTATPGQPHVEMIQVGTAPAASDNEDEAAGAAKSGETDEPTTPPAPPPPPSEDAQ